MSSYPYVASAHDLGRARGPRLAFVVHMAEGGGTVGFLSRPNRDGVSVHFVIEYSGRIVQMLPLDHMHSSLRTTAIRKSDDVDGFYGRTAARAVMGDWSDIVVTSGPNHASIAAEVEGFAVAGPNADQADALQRLWIDLRGRFRGIRSLGHRDFQDYKPCPGRHIPWAMIGGHGPQEADVARFPIGWDPKIAAITPGAQLYQLDMTPDIKVVSAPAASSPAEYTTGGVHYRVVDVPTGGIHHLWLVRKSDCVLSDPEGVDVAALIAADRKLAHIVWG